MGTVSDGAGELRSQLVGDTGPVIVFLHGLFGRGRNFGGAARTLSDGARALLVDLPNHGASPWTDAVDYAQMADAVAALLRAGVAAEGPVHVVGHSMGGKTAMALALAHPDLVDRLVVVDVSPGGTGQVGEFEHLLGALAGLDLAGISSLAEADEALREKIPHPTVRGFLLQNLRRRPDGRFAWQPNLSVLRRDLPVITSDIPRGHGRFDRPTLWIAGSESGYITEASAPLMRELFPQVRKVTVKGAGHWVHSEQPAVFAEIVRRFLLAD